MLNEMLIDAFVVFFRLHELFKASFYEMTFGWRPLREEKESPKISQPVHLLSFIDDFIE